MTSPSSSAASEASYGASDIQVLEGLEAVRKRPGMYIGSTGPRGLHHLVNEIVDNSVDEALAGYCDHIEITILPDGGAARRRQRPRHPGRHAPGREEVDRRGRADHPARRRQVRRRRIRGLGRPARRRQLGRQRALAQARGRGEAAGQRLHARPITTACPTPRSRRASKTDETGTTITFWPNHDIFETVDFDYETLRTRFQQMAFLNKGLRIALERPAAGGGRRRDRRSATTSSSTSAGSSTTSSTSTPRRRPRSSTPRSSRSSRRTRSARIALEVAMQWTNGVLRERPHLRQHDQHARGRNPRRGFPRRAHHARQQVRARQGPAQGEGREPHGRRRARGTHRRHLDQARRAAVRGPDQDQARQHRGQVVRPARRRRSARRLVRSQPQPGARRDPQGDPGIRRPHGGAQGARADPAQGPARGRRHAGQAQRLLEQGPVAERDLPGRGRLGRRLGEDRPRPRDAGDPAPARQDPERREGAARPRARQRRDPGDDHRVRHRHRRGLRRRRRRGITRSC